MNESKGKHMEHSIKKLSATVIFIFIIFHLITGTLAARQEFSIAEVNPKLTDVGIFNSYEHKLILISLVQKSNSNFSCLPNHYFFYDYQKENIYEIFAGNLKVNSNFTYIFRTKIHSLANAHSNNTQQWLKAAKKLMNTFNISSQTMDVGKLQGKNSVLCWQQPELLSIDSQLIRPFNFLVANLCKDQWCSDLYWKNSNTIQFWIHLNPNDYHLIRLNTKSGSFEYQTHRPKFQRASMIQENAPRNNLVTKENFSAHSVRLSSSQNKDIEITWNQLKNGNLKISLIRQKIDLKSAEKIKERISGFVQKKELSNALLLIRFAYWLTPKNESLKFERLKIFASMIQLDPFYHSLEHDFKKLEQFTICKKLHIDPSFRHLWKNSRFINKFNKICR